jgi:hypothetical protein
MPIQTINNLGSGGVSKDTPAINLPPNVFTDALNVRFDNGAVETITGEILYTSVTNSPDFGIHWRRPDQGYNIFAKNGSIVRVDAAGNIGTMLNSNLSQYNNSKWDGIHYNGGYAIIINNGKSTPLFCLYGDASADSQFRDLPGWNYTTGITVTAKLIRPLSYALVAANLTTTQNNVVTNMPGTIRISAQAAPGNIPSVWQPGPTVDTADEFEISSTSPILEMRELRGNLFIYTTDSIHTLTIGTINTVRPYSKGYGILNTNCIAEFDGNHFVVDRNDIYVHNGSGAIKSLIDLRLRDSFFAEVNQSAIDKVFVVRNARNDEIWVCYPTGSNTTCNKAMIFQYRNNTWTFRNLPTVTSAFEGPSPESNYFLYGKESVYMTTGSTRVFIMDRGYQMWNGSALASYTSYVTKEKISSGDFSNHLWIDSIYPIFDNVPSNATINIAVTGQNSYLQNSDFSNLDGRDLFVFQPNQEGSDGYKVDPRVKGRFLNYKIYSTGYWRLAQLNVSAKGSDRR